MFKSLLTGHQHPNHESNYCAVLVQSNSDLFPAKTRQKSTRLERDKVESVQMGQSLHGKAELGEGGAEVNWRERTYWGGQSNNKFCGKTEKVISKHLLAEILKTELTKHQTVFSDRNCFYKIIFNLLTFPLVAWQNRNWDGDQKLGESGKQIGDL